MCRTNVDIGAKLYDLSGQENCDGEPYDTMYLAAEHIRDLESKNKTLSDNLDIALDMLAQWCVAVDDNGTGWDDWDEHYKDAMYRPGPLRELLDKAISEVRKQNQDW